MLREIIIDDEHVAAAFHELLGDAGCGIGRDIREPRGLVACGDDDDGVSHGAAFPEGGHHLGDRRRPLTDGAVHAQHILAALIQDRVDGDRGLAGLAVAENQFALAAPDRHHGIDGFQSGLQRHGHRRAVHDGRRGTLDGAPFARLERAFAVERPTQGIDHAPEQPVADRHIRDPSGARDFIARAQVLIIAEQHHADFIRIDVEGNAEQSAGESHQFLETHAGEPRHGGDAGGDICDQTHLARAQLGHEVSAGVRQGGKGLLQGALQISGRCAHEATASGAGMAGAATGGAGAGAVGAGAAGAAAAGAAGAGAAAAGALSLARRAPSFCSSACR